MMPRRLIAPIAAALLTMLAAAALPVEASAAAHSTVTTTTGRLHGLVSGHAREFLGVRYAEPPTGKRRFAPPQPLPHSDRLVPSTKPGAQCAQTGGKGFGPASLSEDCLFLNVTTPRTMPVGARLPVMFFIHGGGYTSGAGSDYNADRLASQGHVIVVTINYRLGVVGYLGLPGLKGGGDFGLLDAVAALRWTKANASALGSGADPVCELDRQPRPQQGNRQNAALHRPRHAYVPAPAPTRQLRKVSVDFSDQLAYGTPLLPRNPATAVREGHYLHIPVLTGNNLHEEFSFVGGAAQEVTTAFTPQSYPRLLNTAFGAAAGSVAGRYPLTAYPSAGAAFASLITDDSWACPTLVGSQLLARHTHVYEYEFADAHSPNVNQVHAPGIPQDSAHATELPYLFNLGGKNLLTNAASKRLSKAMIAYWTSFAHTGRPTAPRQPRWAAQSLTGHHVLDLDATGIRPVDLFSEHQCEFWQRINPKDQP